MLEELLAGIGRELGEFRIPYMIIGGQAVLLYGEPRLTRDIDITLAIGPDRLPDVLAVASALSLRPLVGDPQGFADRNMVLPTIESDLGMRVDFIFSNTPYEKLAIERARKVELGETEVCFASPEDLVVHKIFSHRPMDLEDVKSVLGKNPDLDLGYIRKWLNEFQQAMPGEDYLDIFESVLRNSA